VRAAQGLTISDDQVFAVVDCLLRQGRLPYSADAVYTFLGAPRAQCRPPGPLLQAAVFLCSLLTSGCCFTGRVLVRCPCRLFGVLCALAAEARGETGGGTLASATLKPFSRRAGCSSAPELC